MTRILNCYKTSFKFQPHVTFNVSMGSKIKDITGRLEDISTRKTQPGLEKVQEYFIKSRVFINKKIIDQ